MRRPISSTGRSGSRPQGHRTADPRCAIHPENGHRRLGHQLGKTFRREPALVVQHGLDRTNRCVHERARLGIDEIAPQFAEQVTAN